jgi:hypothetical protein
MASHIGSKLHTVTKIGMAILLLSLLVMNPSTEPVPARAQATSTRRIHASHFSGDISWPETAVFWFGQVTPTENYADVRVGYNDDELCLRLAVFDRRLWYDTTPSPDSLSDWDAVSLYLDVDGEADGTPDAGDYRFVAQFAPSWEVREEYQATYRGDGSSWVPADVSFATSSTYRGMGGANQDADNRGWVLDYCIPFSSLGLSQPPSPASIWGLGVTLHDRDDSVGPSIPDKAWPETLISDNPGTWGELSFGSLPAYDSPPAEVGGSVTIRHGLGGASVPDGMVGGGTTCAEGVDFWSEWGATSYANSGFLNVQNQVDVADWPCFSKYYVSFPLDDLPQDRVIISATLTLHQFGNSGGGEWGDPSPSLVQVFSLADEWPGTLTWNTAPLALENVAASWVDPLAAFPDPPGIPRTWDVSRAVAQAYEANHPLRLALYSADSAYHSGKYFYTSDAEEWNAEGRPTLEVVWGRPRAVLEKRVWPMTPTQGQVVTYTISLLGNGLPITLTDQLPAQVSAPGSIVVSSGYQGAHYESASHSLTWTGSPAVGRLVTVTFPVTLIAGGPAVVENVATLTDAEDLASRDAAFLIVDAYKIWLPLVLR